MSVDWVMKKEIIKVPFIVWPFEWRISFGDASRAGHRSSTSIHQSYYRVLNRRLYVCLSVWMFRWSSTTEAVGRWRLLRCLDDRQYRNSSTARGFCFLSKTFFVTFYIFACNYSPVLQSVICSCILEMDTRTDGLTDLRTEGQGATWPAGAAYEWWQTKRQPCIGQRPVSH